MFTRRLLIDIRRKALRSGLWNKALDVVDQGIISLTIKVVDVVNSKILCTQITNIINKISDACKSDFTKYFIKYGDKRLKEIKKQAMHLGYIEAQNLGNNNEFVKYLIFLDYNQPNGWRKC